MWTIGQPQITSIFTITCLLHLTGCISTSLIFYNIQHTTYVMLPSFDKDHSTSQQRSGRRENCQNRKAETFKNKYGCIFWCNFHESIWQSFKHICHAKVGSKLYRELCLYILIGYLLLLLVCTFRTIKFSSVTIECLSNLTFKIQPNDSSVRGLTVCKTHTMYHTV